MQKRPAARPKAKRTFPEPLTDREILILGILSLWRSTPMFFTNGIETPEDITNWVNVAVKLWEAPIDISVKISTASTLRKICESAFVSDRNVKKVLLDIVKASLYVGLWIRTPV